MGNGNAAPGMGNVSPEPQRQCMGLWWAVPVGGKNNKIIEELTYLDSLRDAQKRRKNYNHLCASK